MALLADLAQCRLDLGSDVPECRRIDTGERCWTHSPTTSIAGAVDAWERHVADDLGICRTCLAPSVKGDRPNRDRCRHCWVMHHADEGIWPRDCPPFPGAQEDTDGLG